ncbi:MAG TPA: efflux transporter outer membrane subunit [Steroidobacteraceae bacterium]|nr:efflux transporter outer membrane subunit [Steroidobacteraceae bacterium]
MFAKCSSMRRVVLPLAGSAVLLLAGCSYQMEKVDNPVKLPVTWDTPPVAGPDPAAQAAAQTSTAQAATTPAATTQPAAGTDVVPQDWWLAFGSPVLTQLVDEALAGNPSVKIAEERVKQAERALSVSRDQLLPDLSVNASTSRARTGGNRQVETIGESTSVNAQLRYDVDMWGGNAAGLRSSKASLAATNYDLDAARITLSANVATQYFQLLSIRARVAIGRNNLELAERLLRIVDARYRNGVVRQLDLTQQTTAVLQIRAALIPLEAQMRQTETALGLLLGRVPQEFHIAGEEPFLQITVPEVQPWLPSDLLLRRPDLAAAEADLSAAQANIAVARANLLPGAITFTASGGMFSPELLALTDVTKTFSIGGALSIVDSIFNFRARRAQLANAHSSEFITLQNYASAIRSALKDVDDSLANTQTNQRREESQQAVVDQAQRALTLAEAEYREGAGDLQSILDGQRTLFSAQDQLSQLRLARLNSALDLYVALGGGWSAPTSP